MKNIFLSGFFALFFIPLYCQSDSVSFTSGRWIEMGNDKGIILKQCVFENNVLFNSNQCVSVLEIKGNRFDIAVAHRGELKTTSSLAESFGATAAINGSFFNMKPEYNSVNYLRVDGIVIDTNEVDGVRKGIRRQGAIATLNGKLYILKADEISGWEKYIEAEDVVTTGPLLIMNSEVENIERCSFNDNRHPRTAIGKRVDGTVLLVVADGRNASAYGLTMKELQDVMMWLGCSSAINLDGGGSSTMYFKGNVVNHPSDNKKFDSQGERVVQNAILVSAVSGE